MRTAVVIESFDPAAGGNERSTLQILQELAGRGHDLTLLTGYCPPSVEVPGVLIRAFAETRSSSAGRLRGFARWAEQELAGHASPLFDTSLSMTMAVAARIVQPRGGTIRETQRRNVALRPSTWERLQKNLLTRLNAKQRSLLRLERRTLAHPRVYRVAALSRYVIRQLEQHYAFPAERTLMIPNAAVMPHATPAQQRIWREQIRVLHDIPADHTVFLFAAQNPRLKGLGTLIQALGDPGLEDLPLTVLLAGGFGERERRQLAAAGVTGRTRTLGPVADMPPLFAAADVTVLPSWYDPSSKVVLESLMLATPAISTAFNGASDHLVPPQGPPRGLVIADPGDGPALAAAMRRLADPGFRGECSAACVGLADQLSMARHVDRLEAVLRESAEAAPTPPATP